MIQSPENKRQQQKIDRLIEEVNKLIKNDVAKDRKIRDLKRRIEILENNVELLSRRR
jgi:hypothetical protein